VKQEVITSALTVMATRSASTPRCFFGANTATHRNRKTEAAIVAACSPRVEKRVFASPKIGPRKVGHGSGRYSIPKLVDARGQAHTHGDQGLAILSPV
jgi:hypothetical protein